MEKSINSLMTKHAPKVLRRCRPDGLGATALVNQLRPELAKERNVKVGEINVGAMWVQFKASVKENPNVERKNNLYYWTKSSGGASRAAKKGVRKQRVAHRREAPYEVPFCKYLKEDLKECSKVIASGDMKIGPKWGNPDVLGIAQYTRRSVSAKFFDEIVSAEIKNTDDEGEMLKGFGQACAYLSFSHKVYLVVCVPPQKKQSKNKKEFLNRLEAMCHLVGLGLVFFSERKNPANTKFDVKLRARKQHPDMNYLNQMIESADKFLYG